MKVQLLPLGIHGLPLRCFNVLLFFILCSYQIFVVCFKRKVKHSMVKYLKSHGWPERQHCKSVMIPSLVNLLSHKINFIITGKSPPHIILNSLFKQLFHSSDLLFNPECWGSEHSSPRLVSLTFQETAENSCSTGIKCSEFFSPLLLREGVRPS